MGNVQSSTKRGNTEVMHALENQICELWGFCTVLWFALCCPFWAVLNFE